MKKERYNVTGMTCSACSTRVEKCVRKLDGISDVSVNLLTGSMDVKYDDSVVSPEEIIRNVTDEGYGASPLSDNAAGTDSRDQSSYGVNTLKQHNEAAVRDLKLRLIWSIVFMAPIMYISMGAMGLYPLPGFLNAAFGGHMNGLNLAFTEFLLVLPIIFINNRFFVKGFKTLFHGAPNMDSLIAVGATAAVAYGIFAIYMMIYGLKISSMPIMEKYSMELYFESAGMILTLITLGKYFEARSKGKTSEAIEKLMDLAPDEATVVRDGAEITIPVEQMMVGDIVAVRPGESIPADGEIIDGNTAIDESAVTGESVPVEKGPGDTVISASLNTTGFIHFRATKVGEDSTIRQIIKVVEEASASKAPIAKAADKVAGIFVPIVMAIAAAVFIIWLIASRDFELALSMGITVLVISCPCAMGLATPVAIMVGTGKGAQNGILIKSGEALETAHQVDTVVLDKTGTITEGKPVVTDVIVTGSLSENEFLQVAASLENGSAHPLAMAVMEYTKNTGIGPLETKDFEAIHGKGVAAVIGGRRYISGNERFLTESGVSDIPTDKVNELAAAGKTPIMFASDGHVDGIIALADVPKPTSRQAIKEFQDMGLKVVMLTGDNPVTAKAVCDDLGIKDFFAGVLPQDKEKKISELQSQGHKVAMIGDGINDAPALVRSDFGLAIGAGTDVAIESADSVLIKNDLLDAVTAIRLSKATIRNIRQNLFWAFFYNALCIPIAAGVLYPAFGIRLSPMIGSAAMGFSSVFVVGNALRLRLFKPSRKRDGNVTTGAVSTDAAGGTVAGVDSVPNAETDTQEVSVEKVTSENKDNHYNGKEDIKMNKEIGIEGMSCQHCVKSATKALSAIDGITDVTVDLDKKNAVFNASDNVTDDMIREAVAEEGFEVTDIKDL